MRAGAAFVALGMFTLGAGAGYAIGSHFSHRELVKTLRQCESVEMKQHCALLQAEEYLQKAYPTWKGWWTPTERADNREIVAERGGCEPKR